MSNPFEDHAREEFSRHEVPVDVEALWAEVYPKVKEEKKDRKIFWFFLTGFLLASVLFATFYWLQKDDNLSARQAGNVLTKNGQTPAGQLHQQDNSVGNLPDSTSASPDEATSLTAETKASPDAAGVETPSLKERVEKKPAPARNNTNQLAKAATISNTNKNENKVLNPSTNNTKEQIKQLLEGGQNNPALVGTQNNSSQNTKEAEKNDDVANTARNNSVPFTSSDQAEKTEPTPPLNDLVKQEQVSLQKDSLQAVLSDRIEEETNIPMIAEKPAELLPKDNSEKNKEEVLSKKITKGLRYGIGFYGGISRSAVSLSENKPDTKDYLVLRKATEEELETMHLGLNFILQNRQNIYLRTGLEYSRMARLFSIQSERMEKDTVNGVVEIRINGITGDTTEVFGEKERTTIESYLKKSYNYIHLLDAPIIFGYNFGDEQWRIGLEAGVFANVWLHRKGDIFDAEENYYDTGTDERQWYKTNIGITPYIGINAAYNLSENIQLHLTPGFKFRKVFTSDESLLKEERANLGMWGGVKYLF